MNLLKKLKRGIYPIYSKFFSRATLVEGTLRDSDVTCRCLIVDNSLFKDYLISRMFGDSFESVRAWKMWIPSLKKLVRNPPGDIDLCIATLLYRWESTFNGLYDFKSPEHVQQEIDLAGDWEDIKKQFHKKKREIFNRLTTNNPFTYRISTDPVDFDHFYYRMHVPHCRKQFGSFAGIDPYEEMKEYFLKGFLLLLLENDKAIAGSLCLTEGDTMIYRRGGVLDGAEEYIKKGAQSALYFFKLRYAKDHNFRSLNVMMSRPFFDDGVYRHKREWGSSVCVDPANKGWICFFDFNGSGKLTSVIRQNPVIVHTPEGLMGLIATDSTSGQSDRDRKDLAKYYYAPGLAGLILLEPWKKSSSRFTFKGLK